MIAIIDYDAGNLTSVARALSYIGAESVVTHSVKDIEAAERIIFPGVGAAGSAMESLKRLGLDKAVKKVFESGRPVLGICLGTQIIMEFSHEDGGTPCLGIVPGTVQEFARNMKAGHGTGLKIPHMGWNRLLLKQEHPLLSGLLPDDEFYFVHSFYPSPADAAYIIAETDYGISFASVLGFGNIIATQFHPEKSGRPGLSLLKNFCNWKP